MQQPSLSCIQSRIEDDNSLYGRFLMGPFAVGQGITIANALRRNLLSELTGLAITAVEIDGVNHEYSTIYGVRDSVLDILLNIKQIRFTSNFEINEPQKAYLQIKGPGIVVAKNIKLPCTIQCINPDQYITGLSFDGVLRMKFFICRGKNCTIIPTSAVTSKPSYSPETAQSGSSADNLDISLNLQKKNKKESEIYQRIKKTLENKTRSTPISFLNQKINAKEQTIVKSHKQYLKLSKVGIKNYKLKEFINSTNSSFLFQHSDFKEFKVKKPAVSLNNHQFMPDENLNGSNYWEKPGKKSKVKPLNYSIKEQPLMYSSNQISFKTANYHNNTSSDSFFKPENSSQNNLNKHGKRILLPTQAIFAPINKVNFLLETDDELQKSRDRIILEVWTDGSIHPREAIHQAAQSLTANFSLFQNPKIFQHNFLPIKRFFRKTTNKFENDFKRFSLLIGKQNRASLDIANLDLSLRLYTCLKRAGIETIGELIQLSPSDLLVLKNVDQKSLEELKITLNQIGLFLLPTNKKSISDSLI